MLGQRHCLFHSTSAFALIHSRDAELLGTLARGDAFFSRLEGEWWMRFNGEPSEVAIAPAAARKPMTLQPALP
jgi:hypothetical protein